MLDETLIAANVISLAAARAQRRLNCAQPLRARMCCHCGAALGEDESEDECSGAGLSATSIAARRRSE